MLSILPVMVSGVVFCSVILAFLHFAVVVFFRQTSMAAISGSYVSPLAHQGFRQTIVSLEKEFIKDVNKTARYRYPRRLPVIATYKDTGSKPLRKHLESNSVRDIGKISFNNKVRMCMCRYMCRYVCVCVCVCVCYKQRTFSDNVKV